MTRPAFSEPASFVPDWLSAAGEAWRGPALALDVLAVPHATPQALAARQARRLSALLCSAARDSPLYRQVLRGIDPARAALCELPVIDKRTLMRRFDDWVADPALRLDGLRRFVAQPARIGEPYLGRFQVWKSSGSQGEPGLFVQDDTAMRIYDALEAARRPVLQPWRRLFDPCLLGERIAFVGATGGHFASTVSFERLRRQAPAWAGRLRGISFLQPTAALVAQLQAFAPTIVASYPSAALLLACEQAAGRLRLQLNELWTGGETLTPAARLRIEQAFGCPLANAYGASEFLPIASPCRLGRLHLNSDWVLLEQLDGQGRLLPPGESGCRTLLTNLANRVQPLIRFDLGDRTRLDPQRCACGSALPVIEVEGRCDDSLWLGRAGARATLLPLALCTVLEDDAGLFDFELVQHGPCDLVLHAAGTDGDAHAALRRASSVLGGFLRRQGALGVRIRLSSRAPATCLASGKRQRVRVQRSGQGPETGRPPDRDRSTRRGA
jgi:phenylacetate-coenzyme A ligase PaaK-like adenylate-forming protein